MQDEVFYKLYRYEDVLWRSAGLRNMVKKMWLQYRKESKRYTILDVGCGTGGALRTLRPFGDCYGIDSNALALSLAKEKLGFSRIIRAEINHLPIRRDLFDLITVIDVIEHIVDDGRALFELARISKPHGLLILVAPAFYFLWSSRDERFGHKRRYIISEIIHKVQAANFCVLKCSYIHLFCFPLLFLMIKLKRLVGQRVPQIKINLGIVSTGCNFLFKKLLDFETVLLSRWNFPFGVSIVCVCRKN